jgi:hypothetical protein
VSVQKQYFIHVGPGLKERAIGAGKKRFKSEQEAASALRFARGDYWRIAKVTIEEIPGTDAQSLHDTQETLCRINGHGEPESDQRGGFMCGRCTAGLPALALSDPEADNADRDAS